MLDRVMRWFFGQTKLGKLVDGNKTVIGVNLYIAYLVLQGLKASVGEASESFPDINLLAQASVWVTTLEAAAGDALEWLGTGFLGVGIIDDKLKRKASES